MLSPIKTFENSGKIGKLKQSEQFKTSTRKIVIDLFAFLFEYY